MDHSNVLYNLKIKTFRFADYNSFIAHPFYWVVGTFQFKGFERKSNGFFYWPNFGDFRWTQNGDFCRSLTIHDIINGNSIVYIVLD